MPVFQAIIGFHKDEVGDWVAELACGHSQHMRHNPPLVTRPWVLTSKGRARFLGHRIRCKPCTEATERPGPEPEQE